MGTVKFVGVAKLQVSNYFLQESVVLGPIGPVWICNGTQSKLLVRWQHFSFPLTIQWLKTGAYWRIRTGDKFGYLVCPASLKPVPMYCMSGIS
jgi:hypothetical protein